MEILTVADFGSVPSKRGRKADAEAAAAIAALMNGSEVVGVSYAGGKAGSVRANLVNAAVREGIKVSTLIDTANERVMAKLKAGTVAVSVTTIEVATETEASTPAKPARSRKAKG